MLIFFFFQAEDGIRDYKVTGVQTCALPISAGAGAGGQPDLQPRPGGARPVGGAGPGPDHALQEGVRPAAGVEDRKSTRLNSSHLVISYAVFCLKKKKNSSIYYYSI